MSIQLYSAMQVPEGRDITVRRLMPVQELMNFDPFVLWDHFDIEGGGFPSHSHRGFEAITWMFAGGMRHKDDLGNEGTVHAGGAQAFTAGRGITHSEMPDGRAAGIQLWINLPLRLKRIDPAYQEADEVPLREADGVELRFIAGDHGAIHTRTDVEYIEMKLAADARMQRDIDVGWRGLVYVAEGDLDLAGESPGTHINLKTGDAALIEKETLLGLSSHEGALAMWCFGVPHREPIHQHGPFVD